MYHYHNCIPDDVKKCDLYSSNAFNCFPDRSKSSKRKKHRVEAVEVTSYSQNPVVVDWFRFHPYGNSQWQYGNDIDNKDKEIENIPTIPTMKTKQNKSEQKHKTTQNKTKQNKNKNINAKNIIYIHISP